jgi:hypothetical protein
LSSTRTSAYARSTSWLRDTILPAFPEGVLVVLVGRDKPAQELTLISPGPPLTWMIELQNLAAAESVALLTGSGVAEASRPSGWFMPQDEYSSLDASTAVCQRRY